MMIQSANVLKLEFLVKGSCADSLYVFSSLQMPFANGLDQLVINQA